MDSILEEIDRKVAVALDCIKLTEETLHAYKTLLEYQQSVLEDLNTTKRVLLGIQTIGIKPIQLGEDRDH